MSIAPTLRACVLVLSGVLWMSGCGVPEVDEPAPGGDDSVGAAQACPDNPAFQYVSRDPVECLAITFECRQGQRQFFNDCGCGCRGRPARTF